MRYSKKNIINTHLEFCKNYDIVITQENIALWYTLPTKYLKSILEKTRKDVVKQYSTAV
jgi:hypothetical protein